MHLPLALHHIFQPTVKTPDKPYTTQPENLWTRSFCHICLLEFMIFISAHMLMPTFPFYIKSLGGNELIVGFVAGAYAFSALAMRPLAGWILDTKSRSKLLIYGLPIVGLIFVAYIFIPILAVAILLRIVHGFVWSGATTASNTNACDIIPRTRFAEGMGFFGMTNSISMAIAPALGLVVMKALGFNLLFVAAAAMTVASFLVARRLTFQQVTNTTVATSSGNLFYRLFNIDALPASVVEFFSMINYGSINSFIALYAAKTGVGSGGLFFTIMAIFSASTRLFSGKLTDRHGEAPMVYFANFSYLTALLLIAFGNSFLTFYSAAVCFGLGFGTSIPALQAMAVRIVPVHRRGAASSTFLCSFDIAIGMGGIIAGILVTALGYRTMYALMGISTIISILTYLLWARKTPSAFKNAQKLKA